MPIRGSIILPVSILLIENESWSLASSSSSLSVERFVIWLRSLIFEYLPTNKNYLITLSAHQQRHLFLRPIEDWDVSGVYTMDNLFSNIECSPKIESWDVSHVWRFVSQSIVHSAYFDEQSKHPKSNTNNDQTPYHYSIKCLDTIGSSIRTFLAGMSATDGNS